MKFKALIFDWGDTIMRDLDLPGPMSGWERVEWIPGAEEAIRKLKGDYHLVIATSAAHSGREEMIAALKRVGAEKYFEDFFSVNELQATKPDPDFFRNIAVQIGVDPGECLAIGNLYEKDITPARKAGMMTIFYNEKGDEGFCPDAAGIIHHMDELTDKIGELENRL